MIETIEEYYSKIAQSVSSSIEEGWHKATVVAIFYSEHIDFQCHYSVGNGEPPKGFFLNRAGRRAFLDLHGLFKRAKKPLWCRANFELSSDGKFKMNWGYDDCGENGFAKFNEEDEIKRIREV